MVSRGITICQLFRQRNSICLDIQSTDLQCKNNTSATPPSVYSFFYILFIQLKMNGHWFTHYHVNREPRGHMQSPTTNCIAAIYLQIAFKGEYNWNFFMFNVPHCVRLDLQNYDQCSKQGTNDKSTDLVVECVRVLFMFVTIFLVALVFTFLIFTALVFIFPIFTALVFIFTALAFIFLIFTALVFIFLIFTAFVFIFTALVFIFLIWLI